MGIFVEYAWPGNVRELEHTIERILILEDTSIIRTRDLPSFISQRQGEFQMLSEDPVTLQELEKRYIRFVLRHTKGRKKNAAKARIANHTVWRRQEALRRMADHLSAGERAGWTGGYSHPQIRMDRICQACQVLIAEKIERTWTGGERASCGFCP